MQLAYLLIFVSGLLAGMRLQRWLGRTGTRTPPPAAPKTAGLSRQEAFATLGLEPGADEIAIRAAHRHLMKQVHPDAGGTPELARRVQDARDLLLGKS
ncbi:hypothetical protein RMQ97_08665 [Maricaulis sp. D1M11]|uniref:hypothetical protein n=1 Tax=Maricaulis sp. D1M11 TaxID=3076117 RepID=UPI0039B4F548